MKVGHQGYIGHQRQSYRVAVFGNSNLGAFSSDFFFETVSYYAFLACLELAINSKLALRYRDLPDSAS